MGEIVIKLLLGIFFLYALFCALYFVLQKRMIYFPDQTDFNDCEALAREKGKAVESGNSRYYVFETPNINPKGFIIHFHGNGGRACDRYPYLQEVKNLGFHLILAEYPGYAQSAPLPGQHELLTNALETATLIKNKYPQLPMVLFGESLGSAVATWIGSKLPAKAIILQTPFESLGDVGNYHYSWMPVKTFLRHPFPAMIWAKQIKTPVFAFHGEEDEIIPFKMGRRQFENFPGAKNVFWKVPRSGHNDILLRAGGELWERVEVFLKEQIGH